MDRRTFLRRLGAGAAAVAVAPRLLAAIAPRTTTVSNGLTVGAGGTAIQADWNQWPEGVLDFTTSTTVHE